MRFNVRFNQTSQTLNVKFKSNNRRFDVRFKDLQQITVRPDAEYYEGEYNVTPTTEAQTLKTANKLMIENVVINPIPKNYGLITYNGFGITVS